jgi:hypothetical protein
MSILRDVFLITQVYDLQRAGLWPTIISTDGFFGWFGGGGSASTVDRIDYANDLATASVRGPLSHSSSSLAATGNINFGWFGGGQPISTVNRIDYASDLATASVRGPLSVARFSLAATGNTNFGWFGGGTAAPDFNQTSRIDRINYESDTVSATTRGPLTTIRADVSATGGFPG